MRRSKISTEDWLHQLWWIEALDFHKITLWSPQPMLAFVSVKGSCFLCLFGQHSVLNFIKLNPWITGHNPYRLIFCVCVHEIFKIRREICTPKWRRTLIVMSMRRMWCMCIAGIPLFVFSAAAGDSEHRFSEYNFSTLQRCHLCDKLLYGLVHQGLQCRGESLCYLVHS